MISEDHNLPSLLTKFHCEKNAQLPLPRVRLPSGLPPLLGHEGVSGQYSDAQGGSHQQADDSRILNCRSWPTTSRSRKRSRPSSCAMYATSHAIASCAAFAGSTDKSHRWSATTFANRATTRPANAVDEYIPQPGQSKPVCLLAGLAKGQMYPL